MTDKLKKMFTKKAILLALCIYVLPYLLGALPKGIMVMMLTIITIMALVGFQAIKKIVADAFRASSNLYHRMVKIATMSEDEFSSRFQQAVLHTATPASPVAPLDTAEPPVAKRRGSGIPGCCLVKVITDEQAQAKAQEWWENTGRDHVEELIQEISARSPQTSTCQLGDYAERLVLPKEEAVLRALQQIMSSEGLCVDYNEDGYFVIFWGQDSNGKEAGKV